jgi:hypothetical protein
MNHQTRPTKLAGGKIFSDQLAEANNSLEALPQCVEKELIQYIHYPFKISNHPLPPVVAIACSSTNCKVSTEIPMCMCN